MFNAYSNAVLGMLAQSESMETIGRNVANMSTGGYKRSDTTFSSVMSETFKGQSNFGGVNSQTRDLVYESGFMKSSDNALDLAINGHGMFIFNTKSDGTGDTYYGRDGQFLTGLGAGGDRYITDKNGYFLMGYPSDGTDAPITGGALRGVNIDPDVYVNNGVASANASIQVNIPSTKATGEQETTSFNVYDGTGTAQLITATWTKSATPNEWTVSMAVNGGTITTPAAATTVTFDGSGAMVTPASGSITVAGTVGAQALSFALDISKTTQFAGDYTKLAATADGQSNASLRSYGFNSEGYLSGRFTDATSRRMYRIPLANFTNYNGLKPFNGNVYQESQDSGKTTIMLGGAGEIASFVPSAYETSNVKVDQEMTKMITTQQAYSTSATVFSTIDEMEKMAASLKR